MKKQLDEANNGDKGSTLVFKINSIECLAFDKRMVCTSIALHKRIVVGMSIRSTTT